MAAFIKSASGIPLRDVREVVYQLRYFVLNELRNGRPVNFPNLGRFELKTRKGRTGKIFGGKTVTQPTTQYVKFKAAKLLRKEINKQNP